MRDLEGGEDTAAVAPGQPYESIESLIATQACESIHGRLPCLEWNIPHAGARAGGGSGS